jgi:hypothetical protein
MSTAGHEAAAVMGRVEYVSEAMASMRLIGLVAMIALYTMSK